MDLSTSLLRPVIEYMSANHTEHSSLPPPPSSSSPVTLYLYHICRAYYTSSHILHAYANRLFKRSILEHSPLHLHHHLLNYSRQILNMFVDNCIVHRLGLSSTAPSIELVSRSIITDPNDSPTTYTLSDNIDVPLDELLSKLIYSSSLPSRFIESFTSYLTNQSIPDPIIDYVVGKLTESHE